MARCLIGCGSNLGKRREQLDRAVELLRFMPGVRLTAVSRYRETRPIGGPAGQGAYLNGACLIETDLPPHDVLGMLAAVENTLHRERQERWAHRTIDLDLLLYDDLVVESRALTVPHPRLATRRFVLEPCAEIAADLPVPTVSCTIGDLLDNISVPHPLVVVVGLPGGRTADVAAAVADATLSRLVSAPVPLPDTGRAGLAAAWHETLDAWARPLAAAGWHDEQHGTIADYWIDGLVPLASESLRPDELAAVDAEVERRATATVAPHVAILLLADLPAAAARIQDRLARRLRCPGERSSRSPKSVVTVTAADFAGAVAEATAAVEAMV